MPGSYLSEGIFANLAEKSLLLSGSQAHSNNLLPTVLPLYSRSNSLGGGMLVLTLLHHTPFDIGSQGGLLFYDGQPN